MPQARLMGTAGLPQNLVWPLDETVLFLGRDSANQVRLRDPLVSRKHCSISESSAGIFEIADLESHNGTFVNGTRVSQQRIEHGDRIRVGKSEFVFLTRDEVDSDLPSGTITTSSLKTVSLDVSGLPSDT
ncbi:MAG TPA: FHA domain-containing protein, partial [Terriglobales bacterium]